MKIKVIEMSDYADCEQCGGNYADGGVVKIDGEVVLDFTPTAACFGNHNISLAGLLLKTLEHLGHTVEVTHEDVSDNYEGGYEGGYED